MRAGVRMEDMMLRRVIEIEEEKCNGCGACANACHEGAISIVNGKAKLMRDDYCDGLGDCLPTCPMDAIHFVEREAAAYDAAAVEENKRKKAAQQAIASQPLPVRMSREPRRRRSAMSSRQSVRPPQRRVRQNLRRS